MGDVDSIKRSVGIAMITIYWVLVLVSVLGLLIDWAIKMKNNEDGSEGKEQINKSFRSKFFGLGVLFVIGIVMTPLVSEFLFI